MGAAPYQVLRGVVVRSGQHAWPGETLELDAAEGDPLCIGPLAVLRRLDGVGPASEAPAPALPDGDAKEAKPRRKRLPTGR